MSIVQFKCFEVETETFITMIINSKTSTNIDNRIWNIDKMSNWLQNEFQSSYTVPNWLQLRYRTTKMTMNTMQTFKASSFCLSNPLIPVFQMRFFQSNRLPEMFRLVYSFSHFINFTFNNAKLTCFQTCTYVRMNIWINIWINTNKDFHRIFWIWKFFWNVSPNANTLPNEPESEKFPLASSKLS